MKQEIKFIYTVKNIDDLGYIGDKIHRTVEITLDGNLDLDNLLEEFQLFIKAVGYYPPDNSKLDWVDNETEQTSEDDEVANTTVKDKF